MNEFEQAKLQVIEGTKRRCNQRIDVLVNIVNKEVSQYKMKFPTFYISNSTRQQLISKVLSHILNWVGGKYKTEVKSFDDWFSKTRIWWNRDKATKLGNDLFAPIMTQIQEFIQNQCKQLQNITKLELFLDIFISILSTNIIFKQTMPRSLIPHQTFIKNNTFKRYAETFVSYFGINNNKWRNEWNNLLNMKNIPNKNRSSQVYFTYLGYCKNIKNNFFKITNNKNIQFQYIWKNDHDKNVNMNSQIMCEPNYNCNDYNKIIFALADVFMENNYNINNVLIPNEININGYHGVHGASRHVSDVRYQPFGVPYQRTSQHSKSLCPNQTIMNAQNNYHNISPFGCFTI